MNSVVLGLYLIKSLVNYPYKQILLLVGSVPKLALKVKGPVPSKETMLKTISLLAKEKVVSRKRFGLNKPREEVQVCLKLVQSRLSFFLFAFLNLFFFFVNFLLFDFLKPFLLLLFLNQFVYLREPVFSFNNRVQNILSVAELRFLFLAKHGFVEQIGIQPRFVICVVQKIRVQVLQVLSSGNLNVFETAAFAVDFQLFKQALPSAAFLQVRAINI